jgi:AcrR family transcriptional regulator
MARAGRRPGPGTTSDDVLGAARGLFAERGYQATTVRAIAAAAGVTPAMINHFFGSKEKVFLAAIAMPLDPDALLATLLDGPREQLPERLVATFVSAWRSADTGPALQSMLRAAVTGEQHAAGMPAFAAELWLPRLANALGVARLRVAAAVSVLLGQALTGLLLGIEPLASAPDEELVAVYAPAVRAVLDL